VTRVITVNRAPVITLWAAVVAHRLGFDWQEALTLGHAVCGLNAYSKGVSLGLFTPAPKSVKERKAKLKEGAKLHVDLLQRAVPVMRTPDGLRAVSKGRPVDPASVARYLEQKFGDGLDDAKAAMTALARSLRPEKLGVEAYRLYVAFRPEVPAGTRGWGARGKLDLRRIGALAAGAD
jgi:NAD(P)-dependent dehydrogenase (short-subunit alcohol dehydrogenase family)